MSRLPILLLVLYTSLHAAETSLTTTRPSTHPTSRPTPGQILSLTDTTITAIPFLPTLDGSRSRADRYTPATYDLKPYTKYFNSRPTTRHTSPTGQTAVSFDLLPTTRGALQPGRIARIHADGPTALQIILLPDNLPSLRPTTRLTTRPSTPPLRRSLQSRPTLSPP